MTDFVTRAHGIVSPPRVRLVGVLVRHRCGMEPADPPVFGSTMRVSHYEIGSNDDRGTPRFPGFAGNACSVESVNTHHGAAPVLHSQSAQSPAPRAVK